MKKTANYNLNKPDGSDLVDIDLLNQNMDTLDTQVKALSDGKAAASHKHGAGDLTSGTLIVARGGTGQTTAAGIRSSLGLGNTTGAVPMANGGTGATTASAALNALGAAAAGHSHTAASVGAAAVSHSHAWASVTGKPATFAPAYHTHNMGDISGGFLVPELKASIVINKSGKDDDYQDYSAAMPTGWNVNDYIGVLVEADITSMSLMTTNKTGSWGITMCNSRDYKSFLFKIYTSEGYKTTTAIPFKIRCIYMGGNQIIPISGSSGITYENITNMDMTSTRNCLPVSFNNGIVTGMTMKLASVANVGTLEHSITGTVRIYLLRSI